MAAKYQNLCVVGDDDQSIYEFRGANIRNILNFEQEFQNARVIKLEQNYRSTQNILNRANAVIQNNKRKKGQDSLDRQWRRSRNRAWFDTAYDEAEFVADDVRKNIENGGTYQDYAILYRTNAQSRMFEEKFVACNIPYKIVGGVNFYARREIKDLLCYLKTIDNGRDDLAVRRIINVPKRGIGLTTITRIQESAAAREIGFYEALLGLDLIPGVARAASKLDSFVALIEYFKRRSDEVSITDLMNEIIEKTGYIENLEAEDKEDARARIENIEELVSEIAACGTVRSRAGEAFPRPFRGGCAGCGYRFAGRKSGLCRSDDTCTAQRGWKFPHVYLVGMEDGLFPSYMTITSDNDEDLEEERRLCYVGITRAEQELTMTCARKRMTRGETHYNRMSRFLQEIPKELMENGSLPFDKEMQKEWEQELIRQNAYTQAKQAFRQKPFQNYGIQKGAKAFAVSKEKGLDYQVGDRVRHIKFGEGTVKGILEGGRDFEVTVEFDTAGVKKMFATFAKLKKI